MELFALQVVDALLCDRQKESPSVVLVEVDGEQTDEALGCLNVALGDAVGVGYVWDAEGVLDTCDLLDLVPDVVVVF